MFPIRKHGRLDWLEHRVAEEIQNHDPDIIFHFSVFILFV